MLGSSATTTSRPPFAPVKADLVFGLFSAQEDVLGLDDAIHPAGGDIGVQIFDNLIVFEVFGVGIDGIDSRIAFAVGAVLGEGVEAAGSLFGGFRDGFLEVSTGGRNCPDKGY
jgi:hypothetical protein